MYHDDRLNLGIKLNIIDCDSNWAKFKFIWK